MKTALLVFTSLTCALLCTVHADTSAQGVKSALNISPSELIPKASPAAANTQQRLSTAEAPPAFVESDVIVLQTINGEQPGDGFGWVAEDLGDINGDGANDFIVTSPFFGTNVPFPAGKIYVYSGADGTLLNSVTSPGVPVWGYSAKDAGDVDGDGVTDYIVGSFSSVMVFSGATHAVLHQWFKTGEFFGSSVAGVGDLNQDGFDDLVVGARGVGDVDGDDVSDIFAAAYTYTGGSAVGKGYVYSGSDRSLIRTITGTISGQFLGVDALGVGDVNSDGLIDYLLTGNGIIYLISGGQQ